MNTEKAIVIIGPTASGKSDLAIKLAQERNGEVISVDSRQIYYGMDIGTGKITKEERALVFHHLLDICEPGESYNVTDFRRDAEKTETDIRKRGKLPIFCGGTLFWMESYIKKTSFPAVAPDPTLRAVLEKKSTEKLYEELQRLDTKRASIIDPQNKIRLIRALEIVKSLGKVPPLPESEEWREQYELIILNPPREELRTKIKKRLRERFDQGMIAEVEKLLAQGVSHEWLQKIGLEYKYISLYLQKRLLRKELEEQLFHAIWHYAKRQLTYLKRFEEK